MVGKKSKLGNLFRFSLRGQLIIVAVICLWLGHETQRARNQSAAPRVIQDVCFDYELDAQERRRRVRERINATQKLWPLPKYVDEPMAPKWLRSMFGEDLFRSVVEVRFSNASSSVTINLAQDADTLPPWQTGSIIQH
jgi:hypothetical protein